MEKPPFSFSFVHALYTQPLLSLVDQAREVHKEHFPTQDVQLCRLLSVKTGGCPEDCAYCPQSAHYDTGTDPEKMLDVDTVLATARQAKEAGATRFCMGAAWRQVKDGPAFDRILEMVRGIKELSMEACVTLGMLTDEQARRLKEAGLDAYNHNLDTSRKHYASIIQTRTYDDRLQTLERVSRAGISVCCGGILGLGESVEDRCELLRTLANLTPQPDSVPINLLAAVSGTPLAEMHPVDPLDLVRAVAVARILLPKARVRLSAGRSQLSKEAQMLCVLAGANSIFYGDDKLFVTANPDTAQDQAFLQELGMMPLPPQPTACMPA